jgi:predicted DNA-binding transcriptional regulator AlpA
MFEKSEDRFLDSAQVARILSVSVSTLWQLVKRGTFPAPIRYTRKLVRWSEAVVREWMAQERTRTTGS